MTVQVVLTPGDLRPADAAGRTVVIFDVLRATTTMTAALSAGVAAIHVFDNLESARSAAASFTGPKILCGELNCLPPPGFDLGNSPRQWNAAAHAGREVFMSTTNGTRAIAAAAALKPARMLAGAIVNAKAVARAAAESGNDILLLCAGTEGRVSLEDLLGAGAVLQALTDGNHLVMVGDAAQIAPRLFSQARAELPAAMRRGAGGGNLIRAGLEADIDYCAAVNSIGVAGVIDPIRLIVRR